MTEKTKLKPLGSTAGLGTDGYWCVVCGRYLPADDDGLIVHDNVPHSDEMTFDDEENMQ